MHSILSSQARSIHRNVLKVSGKRISRYTTPRHSFHRNATLRTTDPSPTDPTAVAGLDRKPDAQAANHERRSEPEDGATTARLKTPGGQGPSADDSRPNAFYGSAARRRQRSRRPEDPVEPRAAPAWFVQHNVHPLGQLPRSVAADVAFLVKDRKKGYTFEKRSHQTHSTSASVDETEKSEAEHKAEANESGIQKERDRILNILGFHNEDDLPFNVLQGFPTSPLEDGAAGSRKQPKYFADYWQTIEIWRMVDGLLKLPLDRSASRRELAAQKSHLLLHYPAPGGDTLLENLVEIMAIQSQCDLVTLDPHDISELIASEGLDEDIITDGRLLSYDVYCREPELPDTPLSFQQPVDSEESEQPEENNVPQMQPFGTPVIIGKPITVHLESLMRGRQGKRASGGSNLNQILAKMMDSASSGPEKQQSKVSPHLFAPLAESIVAAAETRRSKQSVATSSPEIADSTTKGSVIFHVRDLKAIQETAVGHQFLSAFYEQVQRRRASGERMIIIGTDSEREWSQYNQDRILEMEKDDIDEISRTIVVTPVLPTHAAKKKLLHEKQRRLIAINMRHLWTMTRLKNENIFKRFEHGFWNRDFLQDLDHACQTRLNHHPLSFGQIHRLSTFLFSAADEGKETSISLACDLLTLSDKTKLEWAEEQAVRPSQGIQIPLLPAPRPENTRLAGIRKSATKYEKRLMSGIIEPEKINTTFEDIHVPMETIDAVQILTTLSLIRPEAFSYGVLASDKIPGLLLYGPPGTGKTLLAKAVAKESGATVLEVSSADINNMYVGEGEKNVQALFSLAKKLSPCVIFLDEADAMFSSRARSGKRVSHRELLNQFLREWDGMSNDAGSAFIMVATNRPMDLDDAVLRRLPRRLLVDLPSESDRLEILKIHLRSEQLAEDVNLADIASKTPFYSGSDLKNVAVAAALNCVREENELAKQHKVNGEGEYKHPEKRTLTITHFERALEEITASISEDMSSLKEIKKFDEQYGDKRGKKRKSANFGFKTPAEADKVLETVKVRG